MSEPRRDIPWATLVLAASIVLAMIALLGVAGGLRGALAGLIGAVLVFSLLFLVIWRAGLLEARKAVPITPTVIVILLFGMALVLLLAVLVFVLK